MEKVISLGFLIRQTAALLCAGTLAWDYFRDPSVVGNFSLWAMAIHFIYFQLPMNSRAIAYLHSMSFIGACLIPVMYMYLSYWTPSLEAKHMERWEVEWSTVLTRALFINLAPLAFHSMDITANQHPLINAYRPKSRKLVYAWALCSFPTLGLLFELTFPESEETSELEGINRDKFMMKNKYVCLVALLISFAALYVLVLSKAFSAAAPVLHSTGSRKHHQQDLRRNGVSGLFPKDSLHNLHQLHTAAQSSVDFDSHED